MFHKHKWKEIAITYTPPPISFIGTNRELEGSSWLFEDKTTILWECETCQKLRKEEMNGKIIS
jgi:hypothetical protein